MEEALEVCKHKLENVLFFNQEFISQKRKEGIPIIYTSGVFDSFHVGHADFFKRAFANYPNTQLVISIDSDDLAFKFKGYKENRQHELVRAAFVYEFCSLLGFVDVFVTIHHSIEELGSMIKFIDPEVFFFSKARGGDIAEKHKAKISTFMVHGRVDVFEEFTAIFSSIVYK